MDIEVEWLGQPRDQPLGEGNGGGRLLRAGLDDGELVATEPCNGVCLAGLLTQPIGNALQQHIADRVPEAVVDILEVIKVETKHGKGRAPPGADQFFLQSIPE